MGKNNYINGIVDKFAVNKAYKSDFIGYQPVGFERKLRSKSKKSKKSKISKKSKNSNVEFMTEKAKEKATKFMKP